MGKAEVMKHTTANCRSTTNHPSRSTTTNCRSTQGLHLRNTLHRKPKLPETYEPPSTTNHPSQQTTSQTHRAPLPTNHRPNPNTLACETTSATRRPDQNNPYSPILLLQQQHNDHTNRHNQQNGHRNPAADLPNA